MIAIVSEDDADEMLKEIRNHNFGSEAKIIGEATSDNPGTVIMKTSIGSNRIVDMISGEQLPRIC